MGNIGRYCLLFLGFGTSRERLGDLIRQVVDLKKLEYKSASLVPIGANLSDFLFVHRPMLRHGGAPIWSGLTVKTGENGPNYRDFFSENFGPGPIRTLSGGSPELPGTPETDGDTSVPRRNE